MTALLSLYIVFSVWNMTNIIGILSRTLPCLLTKCFSHQIPLQKQLHVHIPSLLWHEKCIKSVFGIFPPLLWQQNGICYHGNQIFTSSILGNKLFMHVENLVYITSIKRKLQMKTLFDGSSSFSPKTIRLKSDHHVKSIILGFLFLL